MGLRKPYNIRMECPIGLQRFASPSDRVSAVAFVVAEIIETHDPYEKKDDKGSRTALRRSNVLLCSVETMSDIVTVGDEQ